MSFPSTKQVTEGRGVFLSPVTGDTWTGACASQGNVTSTQACLLALDAPSFHTSTRKGLLFQYTHVNRCSHFIKGEQKSSFKHYEDKRPNSALISINITDLSDLLWIYIKVNLGKFDLECLICI